MARTGHITILAALFASLLTGCEFVRTPDSCAVDFEAMVASVEDLVASGQDCRQDSDCIVMDTSNGCYGACPVAVNKLELSRLEKELRDADLTYCREYTEQCGYLAASCPALSIGCIQGQCRMLE